MLGNWTAGEEHFGVVSLPNAWRQIDVCDDDGRSGHMSAIALSSTCRQIAARKESSSEVDMGPKCVPWPLA